MYLTKRQPPGVFVCLDTTKLQQLAHNTQQSLTQFWVGNTNHSNSLTHKHVPMANATWFRIWIFNNKFLGSFSTIRIRLLPRHWKGNSPSNSPEIPILLQHLPSVTPKSVYTTRCVFVTPQGQPLESPQAYSLPDSSPKCMYKRKDVRWIVNIVGNIFSLTAVKHFPFHHCQLWALFKFLMQGILF